MIFGKRLLCRVGEVVCSPELLREGRSATFAIEALTLIACQTLEVSIQDRDQTDGTWTDRATFRPVTERSIAVLHGVAPKQRYRIRYHATGFVPHGHVEFMIWPPEWKTAGASEGLR